MNHQSGDESHAHILLYRQVLRFPIKTTPSQGDHEPILFLFHFIMQPRLLMSVNIQYALKKPLPIFSGGGLIG
jgi:hypothetical protein